MGTKKKIEPKKAASKHNTLIYAVIAVCVVAIAAVVIILTRSKPAEDNKAAFAALETVEYSVKNEEDPVAVITMDSGSTIIVELYPDVAPNTVANFIELANDGFYDGLIFHRVISGFMIQGGDPNGNGTGGPGYTINGEFTANGFENLLSHDRGVISMARSTAYNSAGSQFFIMHADYPSLDGQYAAFGKVVYGMDTVDAIASVKTDANNKPKTEQKIKTIRVDTKGVEYTAEKIK